MLNDDSKVHRINVEGDIPFIDARTTALQLVDTPGSNNSQNQAHKNATYSAINNDSNNLILYVLNGTQLSTSDDASLLDYVAEQISKGGKQIRDRFMFVINKMDCFNSEEENIAVVVTHIKEYLSSHGIHDPQIFPCSAFVALNLCTTLREVEKRELEYRLAEAQKNGDTKTQAFIHCGLYSIEAAITAYVKKYAQTKKIKDLIESFYEILKSSQVLAKAKIVVATDEDAAKAYAARAEAVKVKIRDGQEAQS